MAIFFEEVVVGWVERGWNEKSPVLEHEEQVSQEQGEEKYPLFYKALRSS